MFARLGTWCHDHRKRVLVLWLAVLILGGAASGAAGSAFRDEFNLPDVESRQGFDILDDNFDGAGTGATGTIVFKAEQGVDDPEVEAEMTALFDEVAGLRDVNFVSSPYTEEGERQIATEGRRPAPSPSPTSRCPKTSTSPGPARSATRSWKTPPRSRASRSSWAGSSSPSSRSRPPRCSASRSPWSS